MSSYDLLIKNTLIVDGSGKASFIGNVAVKDENIVAVGETSNDAVHVIDGTGWVTCPGFIDPHSHADLEILNHPQAENMVMQGITTFVGGNCGLSWAPIKKDAHIKILQKEFELSIPVEWQSFADWLAIVEKIRIAPNYVPCIGHQAIRCSILGDDFKRTATPGEIHEMKKLLAESMESGARGLSTFRDPSPTEYASLDELISLAKITRQYNGIYMPHTKQIQSQWPANTPEEDGYGIYHGPMEDVWVGRYRGYLEAVEIGRKADIPVHIAHISPAFHIPQPHSDDLDAAAARSTLDIIDQAIAQGSDITFDVIPCCSSIAGEVPLITSLAGVLDSSDPVEFEKQLQNPELKVQLHNKYDRGRVKVGMIHTKADPYWMNRFKITQCNNKYFMGKTIGEISHGKNLDPIDTLLELVKEDPKTKWVQFQDDRLTPGSLPVFLKHAAAMASTDTFYVSSYKDASPTMLPSYGLSPIMFGLYPHYIETYVRQEDVLKLEEAVQKATSIPAKRFGINNRGILKPGACADIVIFDLETIHMSGDFSNPAQAPEGVKYTIINGQIVYDGKNHTGALPGKVLKC